MSIISDSPDEDFMEDMSIHESSVTHTVTDATSFEMKEPVELQLGDTIQIDRLKSIFPKCQRYQELRMTDVGLYSVTRREESYYITHLIVKYFPSGHPRLTITDSCSGMGGNGISFLLHPSVEKVNFIELNPLHYEILKHNIGIYGLERKANIYQDNFLQIGPKLHQDIIFHDFPWGGSGYREAEHLRLGLCRSNEWNKEDWVPIDEIVNEFKPRTRLQVCKVPTNFAFHHFFEHIEFQKIKIHKVYNRFSHKLYYYLIFLFS